MTKPSSTLAAPPMNEPSVTMGSLELLTYRKCWRRSWHFRSYNAEIATQEKRKRAAEIAEAQARASIEKATKKGKRSSLSNKSRPEEAKDQNADDERSYAESRCGIDGAPQGAGDIAASLFFSRLFDRVPNLLQTVRSAAPVIVIDISDAAMLRHVTAVWRGILFADKNRLIDLFRDKPIRAMMWTRYT